MPTFATRQAAKFWVGLVAVIFTSVATVIPDSPKWVFVVIAVSTAIGVYAVKNESAELPAEPDSGDE
jgi:hypothetical protein